MEYIRVLQTASYVILVGLFLSHIFLSHHHGEKPAQIPTMTTTIRCFFLAVVSLISHSPPSNALIGPTIKTTKAVRALHVSELHIPGYRESKIPFILTDDDINELSSRNNGGGVLTAIEEEIYTSNDYISLIPYQSGHLLHKSTKQIFSSSECQDIVEEAERIALEMGWTTNRHGNYPTTDIPIVELPNTMKFLRKALAQRIYPLLRTQFAEFLPAPYNIRVADGFIVKYDVEGGQAELKPHRDGSVLSFNIALNPSGDFEGGGTWFNSLNDAVKIEEGEMVSHASAVLHGGHAITTGRRYILVAFVIVEGYDSWSMRFYNNVRHL